jgi:hypothetical protein
MSDDIQHTKNGQSILRHRNPEGENYTFADLAEHREAIEEHLEKHLGGNCWVFHELISSIVHMDVYVYPPNENRDFYTLVTMGMSDLPMTTSPKWHEYRYAELMICLPSTWKLTQADFSDENNYWPIRALKTLAKFPHECGTWLGYGHSIPYSDDHSTIANTHFSGYILGYSLTTPVECGVLQLEDKNIYFHAVYPVYSEEMQFKLVHPDGFKPLFDLIEANGYTEVVDINRKNLVPNHQS